MVEAGYPHVFSSKCKAISAITPFAISLERGGQQGMLDIVVRAFRCIPPMEGCVWFRATFHIDMPLRESGTPSLDRALALLLPYGSWIDWGRDEDGVARWATAVLAIPYTEEVGRSVVDATLRIAYEDSPRQHIPIGVWALFKERPSLPPTCEGLSYGTNADIIDHVRSLGDLEILKSYFLLAWCEWTPLFDGGLDAIEISIRKDFCGPGLRQHRKDFIQRVDYVLGELGREPGYLNQSSRWPTWGEELIQETKERYGRLKDVLLEVEREATIENLTRTSSKLSPFDRQRDSHKSRTGDCSTCALPLMCL